MNNDSDVFNEYGQAVAVITQECVRSFIVSNIALHNDNLDCSLSPQMIYS